MNAKTTVAHVSLPLLMTEEAEFLRTEISALHPGVAFEFSTEIVATASRVTVRHANDEPATKEEQVAFVLTRQQIEAQLDRLLAETKKARTEQRDPVSPFR